MSVNRIDYMGCLFPIAETTRYSLSMLERRTAPPYSFTHGGTMKITLENLTPETVLTLATYFLAESGHAELSIDQSWHPEDHLTPGQLTKHRISNELFHLHHILTQEMETEAKQNILKLVS